MPLIQRLGLAMATTGWLLLGNPSAAATSDATQSDASASATAPISADTCIAPISYLPLDAAQVGRNDQGVAALGTYERISPDGRYVLRSYSGARLGRVSLMELPAAGTGPVLAYRTPLSNEAFPVQGSWRYLVDVNGQHYRLAEVLRQQTRARPLFRGGMTGFYAAASELAPDASPGAEKPVIRIRSLSWPQDANPDQQGVGPLQVATIEVQDDGRTARLVGNSGARFICGARASTDGNVYALPMISIDGSEFSAIPQVPRQGQPSMRVYGLAAPSDANPDTCELRADLGESPGKAVFGFPRAGTPAWLTYSDLGQIYVHDRELRQSARLEHAKHRVLVTAFPGLTRDGRVIYGATWHNCADPGACPTQTGYVVADPYQSEAYRALWRAAGHQPPRQCITTGEVQAERARFARLHGLTP